LAERPDFNGVTPKTKRNISVREDMKRFNARTSERRMAPTKAVAADTEAFEPLACAYGVFRPPAATFLSAYMAARASACE